MPTITATTPYEQHRDYVLAVLARRCRWLEPDERESMLHDAYMVFLQKERDGLLDVAAMRPEQVRAYLTQTAINKAMDDGNRARRKRSVALEDAGGLEVADQRPDTIERFVRGYDAARVREIVDELPERQQLVVKLRFFLDLSPTEVQQHLGITERAYRRDLERAMRALSDDVDLVRRGTSCDQRRSLILAYVAGIAGPNRVLAARRHLATCSGCAAWAAELRTTAQQAGAVVPLPLGGAATVHHEHWWQKALDHVTGWMLRADPGATSALGAARPGAVAALVAGCLTVGGTTYCAVDLGHHPTPPVHHHHVVTKAAPATHATTTMRRPEQPVATTAKAPAKRVSSHARTRARTATASTSASRASTARARRVETQAAQQFGVEGASSAPTVQQNATAAAAKAVRPAPGGGASAAAVAQEFGP